MARMHRSASALQSVRVPFMFLANGAKLAHALLKDRRDPFAALSPSVVARQGRVASRTSRPASPTREQAPARGRLCERCGG